MQSNQLVKNVFTPEKHMTVDQGELLTKGQKRFPDITTYFRGFNTDIGIEVEVENVHHPDKKLTFWELEEDGSLKIRGLELISAPICGHNIDYALAELQEYLDTQNCLWSHRTSIHVHIYVGDFTIAQLRTLTALYAVMEPLFFSMVADTRRGNSFCYHIRDLCPDDVSFGNNQLKYCAFNVGTGLTKYNTVEFRHMHGTSDMQMIRRWIQLIVKLHKYVKENTHKDIIDQILNLNTTSAYQDLVFRVFGKTSILFLNLDLKKELEDGVLWAKVFFACGEQ